MSEDRETPLTHGTRKKGDLERSASQKQFLFSRFIRDSRFLQGRQQQQEVHSFLELFILNPGTPFTIGALTALFPGFPFVSLL